MKLKLQELLNALKAVRPGISSKPLVDQMSHFIFTGKRVFTYNDRICVSYPLETDFACSVNADDLYSITSKLDDESIDIVLDNSQLIVSAKSVDSVDSTESGLPAFLGGEIAETIDSIKLDECRWKLVPNDFVDAISLCVFSTSVDATQGVLTCVCVRDNCIFSSDDQRISMYTLASSFGDRILIPRTSALELIKFPVVDYDYTKIWIHFRTKNDVTFSSRIMSGDYPEDLKLFDLEGVKIRFPKGLKEVIESVTVFAKGEFDYDKEIEISIKEGVVKCRSESEGRWIEKKVSMRYGREPIRFVINPVFFAQVLDKTTSVVVNEAEGNLLFFFGSFKHLMALPLS